MRFAFVATLIAGAVLGEVAATPVVITLVGASTTETARYEGIRLGHAVPAPPVSAAGSVNTIRRPCKAHLSQKSAEISNAFREFFGLPLIKTIDAPGGPADDGRVHILPFVGTPPTFIETDVNHGKEGKEGKHHGPHGPHGPHGHHGHHGHPKHHGHKGKGSFMNRLQVSLLTLGPWEGRAVAFVLGCGIGVLLRMFFVLSVVCYRMIKGGQEVENRYTPVFVVEHVEHDDEVALAPPTYTYADEKAGAKVADAEAPDVKAVDAVDAVAPEQPK